VLGMRMVNDAKHELAPIDFVHHRQMLLRLHQERRARIARKRRGIFGVHPVLDIGDRADFLDRAFVIADDEAAALEGKLALGLRDHRVHARAAYRCSLHSASFSFRFPVTVSNLAAADSADNATACGRTIAWITKYGMERTSIRLGGVELGSSVMNASGARSAERGEIYELCAVHGGAIVFKSCNIAGLESPENLKNK